MNQKAIWIICILILILIICLITDCNSPINSEDRESLNFNNAFNSGELSPLIESTTELGEAFAPELNLIEPNLPGNWKVKDDNLCSGELNYSYVVELSTVYGQIEFESINKDKLYSITDESVRRLGRSGRICEIFGHQWDYVYGDCKRGSYYLCSICGKSSMIFTP